MDKRVPADKRIDLAEKSLTAKRPLSHAYGAIVQEPIFSLEYVPSPPLPSLSQDYGSSSYNIFDRNIYSEFHRIAEEHNVHAEALPHLFVSRHLRRLPDGPEPKQAARMICALYFKEGLEKSREPLADVLLRHVGRLSSGDKESRMFATELLKLVKKYAASGDEFYNLPYPDF